MAKGKKNKKPHPVPKIPTGAQMLKAAEERKKSQKL